MTITSLHEFYVEQLRDLLDAEHQIIKALPDMVDAATSEDLKEGLTEHLEVTKAQAERLEDIFQKLGEKSKGEKCKGIKGVLEEGSEVVAKVEEGDLLDAAIIASAQRVEHYEMAGYGTAAAIAAELGEDEAVELLKKTLDEEKEADQKLTELAEKINAAAQQEASAEGETKEGKPKTAGSRTAASRSKKEHKAA
jgi:ferritin-like metal-binding protein YciE